MLEDEIRQFSFDDGNVYVCPTDFSTYKLTFLVKSVSVSVIRVSGPRISDI